jgi:excisionase family DNA binding protein
MNNPAYISESELTKVRLVTIATAATMLSLSVSTVRRLIKKGSIRCNRKTRHCLIPVSEIERFASV